MRVFRFNLYVQIGSPSGFICKKKLMKSKNTRNLLFLLFFWLKNVLSGCKKILFIWDRDWERERARAREQREREKQAPHRAGSLTLRAPSQNQEIMTSAKGRCLNNWATQVLLKMFCCRDYMSAEACECSIPKLHQENFSCKCSVDLIKGTEDNRKGRTT